MTPTGEQKAGPGRSSGRSATACRPLGVRDTPQALLAALSLVGGKAGCPPETRVLGGADLTTASFQGPGAHDAKASVAIAALPEAQVHLLEPSGPLRRRWESRQKGM